MPAKIDMDGLRFGRLVVESYADSVWNGRIRRFLCKCDCGKSKIVRGDKLRSGNTVSCGCFHNEGVARLNFKHGMTETPTFRSWEAMHNRCKYRELFPTYAEVGVVVCERWADFKNFLADMGERPEGKSLDRINSYGNYEPSNCRWATAKEQANNQRRYYPKGLENVCA